MPDPSGSELKAGRMKKITSEVDDGVAREIDRLIRDGWFADSAELVREAVESFVEARTFLGDSPRMLLRFAADALNESKPEVALKFADRATSLVCAQKMPDLNLYQKLVELRVQILLVVDREKEAVAALEEARERLPNSPSIRRWLEKLKKRA